MIEFLSKWIEGIAIAVIIASIFEMILPNGNIKKYVKVILGIYIVFSIISPFSGSKVKGNFDLSKKVDDLFENSDKKSNFKDEATSEQRLNKIYENTFEKELIQTIEKEGFIVYKCDVKGNFNAEEKNAGISKISITLENIKVLKKKEEDKNEIKIDSVNEVQKVEINIKNKITNETEEDVNAKDLNTLRRYLSKHYEIDKGIIDIHVR